MKAPFLFLISATCLWTSSAVLIHAHDPSKAESDPFADPRTYTPRQVRVQVEYIEVSLEQFTELMFGAKPAASDSELREQLARLAKDGKARIVETLLCTSQEGKKATTESIEEFIYPTEYEPAELPLIAPEKEDDPPKVSRKNLIEATGPTPTAFETRNLGSTLEIAPKVSPDGKLIELIFVPELVYHVGNTVWSEWKGKHGNSPIQMPLFYTLRLNTSATLTNGCPALVAALSPKDDKGIPDPSRKFMVFVKADVFMP